MTTTQQQFDYVCGQIDGCQRVIATYDCPPKIWVDTFETLRSIQDLIIGKMEFEAAQLANDLGVAKLDLLNAIEEERLVKLRKRKTSKGMNMYDFVNWAKGRSIQKGERVLGNVFITDSYFHISYVLGFVAGYPLGKFASDYSVNVDTTKVWRIVE